MSYGRFFAQVYAVNDGFYGRLIPNMYFASLCEH